MTKPAALSLHRLRELARRRLDRLHSWPEEEAENIKKLRAEGWCIVGGRGGYVLLPPEHD
jgi:hypothetical protein